MRKTCLNTIYNLAKHDERIVYIGSDVGHGTLDNFKKEFPERFFMEGIAEANTVGMSAGMALDGHIVYVNTIAPFFTRRAFEQVVIDLCMHNANVRLIANGAGTVYAPLGPTHETLEDIAVMRSLPNMCIIAPADANEMQHLIMQTTKWNGPIYVRLAKGYDPIVTKNLDSLKIGQAAKYGGISEIQLLTTGITLQFALAAQELLQTEGFDCSVTHFPTLKPIDSEIILTIAKKSKLVISIEEHSKIGGLGGIISEIFCESNIRPLPAFKKIAFEDKFPDFYGSQAHHLEANGISTENIFNTVKKMWSEICH